jgi:hypothetical protein
MPMKIRLAVPDINIEVYIDQIKKVVEEEHEIAIKKWLKAVLARTPTYTGTARGTYAPVGRVVGYAVRKGKIKGNAERARKKKYFVYNGKKYPLGFGAGAQYSEHVIRVRKYKAAIIATFKFDQNLPYVLWNEMQPGPPWFLFRTPPPWWAVKAGNTAYTNHHKKYTYKSIGAVKMFVGTKVVKSG